MKVLIAIDSSPASQRVLEEVAARPWPSNTAFCIVSAVEVHRFSELPALVADAKRECEQLVKAGAAKLLCTKQTATTQVLMGSPRRAVSAYAQDWGADLIVAGSQRNIAKVAMGRRMGVRLYWMWRNGREYSPSLEFGSHAGELGTGNGGQ